MAFDLEDYLDLKTRVEKAQQEAQKAEWELEKLMVELREQYNCETVEEAEQLLAEKEAKVEKAEQVYETELKSFMQEWGDRL